MSFFPHRTASHIGQWEGIVCAVGLLIGVCVDAGAADGLSRAKAWSIAERGPHHTRWEAVAEVEIEGLKETITHSYTELRTGMHYWDEQQSRWLEARDDIELINGIGVARQSGIQVVFSPDFADPQGNIEIWLPDGKQFRTQLAGIALTESRSGQSVWIAKPRSSQAHLVERNEMLYTDAFEGLHADVRYTHSAASFEQDIVIKEQPPSPADFGLDEESTRLEVWTEFFTASEPALHSSRFQRSPEEIDDDQTIDFGSVSLIPGKAFRTQSQSPVLPPQARGSDTLPVSKSWIQIGDRKFLIESLPLRSMRRALEDLPRPQAGLRHFLPADREVAVVLNTPTRQMPQTPPLTFSVPSVVHDQVARVDSMPHTAADAGFVIDYNAVTTTSDYTFKADSTYLISGTVNLSGTNNLFEGGAVLKYAASPASTLRILGHAQFQSSPYRPVFFTAKDDNTIGETISGSTGNPTLGYYGDPAIAFEGTNAVSLKHARFLHARNGVTLGFSSPDAHSITHVHFLRCESAIRPYKSFTLGNALFSNLSVAFEGNSAYPVTITAAHLTLSSINTLSTGAIQSVVTLVNCLLVNVPNWGSGSPLQDHCYTAPSVSEAFQSAGGGAFYLKDPSPYRNMGISTIDPALASDLKSRTTYAPTVLSAPITADTLLSIRVQRDTDTPDIGYHYEPLDYLIPEILISNAVVTLTNGVAIGTTSAFGFSLANGAVLESRGTALKPNRLVRFRTAQESPITGGDSMSANIRFVSNSSPPPSLKALFTDFSVLPGLGYNGHLQGTPNGSMHAALSHCALHGGRINLQNWTGFPFASTNTLYERVYTLFQATSVSHFNNLHRGGTLKFYVPSTAPWTAKDNLFDNTSLFNGSSPTLDLSHNAYITNANRFSPEGPNNVTLPASPNYQSTALGSFYLPPNSGLADVGSRTSATAGLYHFTTSSTALSKEASSQVDIGLHYPAITATSDLTDSDGDGPVDIFEDVNGDGSASGEAFSWQSSDTDGDGLGDLLEYELSTNLQVNDPAQDFGNEQNTQFEPHLTLLNDRVIVSFVDANQGEYGLGGMSELTNHIPQFVSYSVLQPGSSTFQDMGHPPLSTMGTPADSSDDGDGGDPVLAVDPTLGNMGTIYMVGTSMRSTNGWKGFPLWKSTDGGLTFNPPITVAASFANSDKPWIAVDTSTGTGQHDVYLVGQSIRATPARLMLTVSTDGSGSTWSNPNYFRTQGVDGVDSFASPIIVTGPDHKAYLVWLERTTAGINQLKSSQVLNRGATLQGTNTVVQLVNTEASPGNLQLKRSNSAAADDYFTALSFPVVAANPSPSKPGHLYVAYADRAQNPDPNDRADVFLVQSTNGGVTWSSPIRISSVPTNDQWMPVMTVKPDGSKLFLAWYDRRNDPNNSLMDLYGRWATLDGSGAVILGTEFKITTQSSVPTFAGTRGAPYTNNGYYDPAYPPGDVDLSWWYNDWPLDPFGDPTKTFASYKGHAGEYNGASSDNAHIFCAWTDHRNVALGTIIGRTQADVRFLRLRW